MQYTWCLQLVAYVGGLDLTQGRYDIPDHSLFSTLDTVHARDVYQNCITGFDSSKGGEAFAAVACRRMVQAVQVLGQ